jgi:hypothetical protein
MVTAKRLFTQAKIKNQAQTVEFDTRSKKVGSVAIILYL